MDSGSTDRTVEIARPYCDQVISIPAEAFTYGHALNLGVPARQRPGGFRLVGALRAVQPTVGRGVARGLHRRRRGRDMGATRLVQTVPRSTARPSSAWLTWERRYVGVLEPRVVLAQAGLGALSLSTSSSLRARTRNGCGVSYRPASASTLTHACGGLFTPQRCWPSLPVQEGPPGTPGPRRDAGLPSPDGPGPSEKWWSEFPDGSSRPNWQRRLSPWRAAELTGEYTGDLAGTRRRRDGGRTHGHGRARREVTMARRARRGGRALGASRPRRPTAWGAISSVGRGR